MSRADDPRVGMSRGPASRAPRAGPSEPKAPRLASPWLPGRSIDGSARILRQGILDHDATVLELLPKRTFTFWGRSSTVQSFPLPLFDTRNVSSAVVSVAVQSATFFLAGSSLHVRIDNAVQTADEPAVIFAEAVVTVTVPTTSTPTLFTTTWSGPMGAAAIGPSARLRVEWQQGAMENTVFPAVATLAVFLTLRRG